MIENEIQRLLKKVIKFEIFRKISGGKVLFLKLNE